jgi:hypothetical protein
MNIDFAKILQNSQSNDLEPRDIFMALPGKDKKYEYPRDVQSDVWKKWFECRDNKNSIIKMNTGSGKTTVGLLILKSCLNEGVGPAVYVVPDSYLVEQVCKEAQNLGIKTSTDEKDSNFIKGQSILIINIHKLVNGKSVFGMRGINNVEIGSIIIDDAHACITTIKDQYTLQIPNGTEMYSKILQLFSESLKNQCANKFTELCMTDSRDLFMLVPYWEWQEHQNEVYEIIRENLIDGEPLSFRLPLLKDHFQFCDCIVTNAKIEISIKSIPISKISSFEHATRRIFMTATLADDSVLSSELGVYPDDVPNVISPDKANDIGDRLIIMPQVMNRNITNDEIKQQLLNFSNSCNVVIIVPSKKRAEYWSDISNLELTIENLKDGVEKLKSGHVGIAVLINKYDGVDLPDEACSILVIDGLPPMNNVYDQFEKNANPKSSRLKCERIQKLEQGMGRGVRSNSDSCAVILMGRDIAEIVYANNGLNYFSKATKKQLEVSDLLCNQIDTPNATNILSMCNYSIDKNEEWIAASKATLSSIEYDSKPHFNNYQVALRKAFDLAERSQYDKAIDTIEQEINDAENKELKGLLLQYKAELQNFVNQEESQETLLAANCYNRMLINPIKGIVPEKYAAKIAEQGRAIYNYITENEFTTNGFLIKVDGVLGDLCFNSVSSKKFEAAIKELGFILGLNSTRPEEEFGSGPDNLWQLDNQQFVVIECKNEATTEFIPKKDCNQLNGSINWLNLQYHGINECYPIMIHHSVIFSHDCSPETRTRIIDEESLNKLKMEVKNFASSIAGKFSFSDVMAITASLKKHKLIGSMIIDNYSKKFRVK